MSIWKVITWMPIVLLIGMCWGMRISKHYLMMDIHFLQDRLNKSPKLQETNPALLDLEKEYERLEPTDIPIEGIKFEGVE